MPASVDRSSISFWIGADGIVFFILIRMQESLETLREEILDRVAHCGSEPELDHLRVEYLGRKGRITLLLRGLREIPAEERPQAGEQLNRLRQLVEGQLEGRLAGLKGREKEKNLPGERVRINLSR